MAIATAVSYILKERLFIPERSSTLMVPFSVAVRYSILTSWIESPWPPWKLSRKNASNAGISAGLSQSFYGTCLRTIDNQFLDFGREDYLPYDKSEEKVYVRTLGQRDFKDSFELDLKVKIGFSF